MRSQRSMCQKNLITEARKLQQKFSSDTLTETLRMVEMAQNVNLFNEYYIRNINPA